MGLGTDEWIEQCEDQYNVSSDQALEMFDFAIDNPHAFTLFNDGDIEGFKDYMDEVEEYDNFGREGEDIDADSDEEGMLALYPEDFPYSDYSMYMGSASINSKFIVETENDNVYVPPSNFCSINALNKYFEIETGHKDLIKKSGLSPNKVTKQNTIKQMLKYVIKCACPLNAGVKKCNQVCIDEKRKKYMTTVAIDKNKFFKDNFVYSSDTITAPTFCKISIVEGQPKLKVTNKAAHTHPKMCIGLVYSPNVDNSWHAVLIKDRTKLTLADLKLTLSNERDLAVEVGGVPEFNHKTPKKYCLAWDIEAHMVAQQHNQKYTKYLIPSGAAGQIFSLEEKKDIGPYIESINMLGTTEEDRRLVLEKFFNNILEICEKNNITELVAYGHNSSKFDSLFCMDLNNIVYGNVIKKGNQIKTCEMFLGPIKSEKKLKYKLKIVINDTLPYTLASLKNSCKTFKTEVKKMDFDIIDKTRFWYCINSSQKLYDAAMQNEIVIDAYVMDRYELEEKLGLSPSAIAIRQDICSGYKDWRTYLTYDVTSLQALIYKIEEMYLNFGFSITNHLGIPGLSYSVMTSYCYGLNKCYIPKSPKLVELYHQQYYGGRTIVFKNSFDSGTSNDFLICIDMNSLYPSVMHACGFPTGKPKLIKNGADLKWLERKHYIATVDIEIPNIRYAIHPFRVDGALVYPSNQTICKATFNDVDMRQMISDGYKVVKFHEGVYFNQSKKVFGQLVSMLYDLRNVFKALNPEDPEYTKEYICKIILNSMYGKFGETIKDITNIVSLTTLKKMVLDKLKFTNILLHTKIVESGVDKWPIKFLLHTAGKVGMKVAPRVNGQFMITEKLVHPQVRKPTYIAGYVTSYSRALVNEIFRKIGRNNVFASDTDSIYLLKSVFDAANFKCDKGLCGFKNDYGENTLITKARFMDIKRAYLEFDQKVAVECFDKFGKHHEACRDPITKQINTTGKSYSVQTFKFKFTGICFGNVQGVTTNSLTPSDSTLSLNWQGGSEEEYHDMRKRVSSIVDDFITNQETFMKTRRADGTFDYDAKVPIKFIIEQFHKTGMVVTIDKGEYQYIIAPERRGQWFDNEYFALGYDRKKNEFTDMCNDPIGTLVASFNKLNEVNYGLSTGGFLRSYRPLFYPQYYKYQEIARRITARKGTTLVGTDPEILAFNASPDQAALTMEIGKITTDAAILFNKGDRSVIPILNKYHKLKCVLEAKMLHSSEIAGANEINMSDIIFDKTKTYDTDYYLLCTEEPTNSIIFKGDPRYQIINKKITYGKGKKTFRYFTPNKINVKSEITLPENAILFPIIMLSDKYNAELGQNNLTQKQTTKLYSAVHHTVDIRPTCQNKPTDN